jgi:hypothetical protein
MSSPAPQPWQFYDRLADLYRAAEQEPPSRAVVDLHEIASDAAAEELLGLIKQMATTPEQALVVAERLLAALDASRNDRDFHARTAVDPTLQLLRSREQDFHRHLHRHLGNPDRAQVVLSEVLIGATAIGEDIASVGVGISEDGSWALELLRRRPAQFRRVLESALRSRSQPQRRLDLVRRLRDLSKKPSCRRLCTLLRDARAETRARGTQTLPTLIAALRFAARGRYGARGKRLGFTPLSAAWFSEMVLSDKQIGLVAGRAHQLLRRSLPGPGVIRDRDLERYCGKCAAAYEELVGKQITYSRATENSRPGTPPVSGQGLRFMVLAMRLVDSKVTDQQARRAIDRVRKFIKCHKIRCAAGR